MYYIGAGVPEDHVLGYMWYNLSAGQGDQLADMEKDIAELDLTREQIAEGQRMSREWIEAHPSGN
jgi:TPR repeat protein